MDGFKHQVMVARQTDTSETPWYQLPVVGILSFLHLLPALFSCFPTFAPFPFAMKLPLKSSQCCRLPSGVWDRALTANAFAVYLNSCPGNTSGGCKCCYISVEQIWKPKQMWFFWILVSVTMSQLPKLCVKISILRHRHMWVRSFSTRLTSVTFAEDKVLIFLILRKNAKIVQLWV